MKPLDPSVLEKIWSGANTARLHEEPAALAVFDQLAAILAPGEYYFLIVDLPKLRVRFASPRFYEKLDLQKSAGLRDLLRCLSEEEFIRCLQKERAARSFFTEYGRKEDLPFYKAVYTLELDLPGGNRQKMLHQAIPLELGKDHRVNRALIIHTDAGHLATSSSRYLNLVGSDGRPSYYHIHPQERNFGQEALASYSSREMEVLRCIAEGLKTKQIADQLNIAPSTVTTHRKKLLRKSGYRNMTLLIADWVRKGLL